MAGAGMAGDTSTADPGGSADEPATLGPVDVPARDGTRDGSGDESAPGRVSPREVVAVLLALAVAALTRLPDLAARGGWDSDQGGQMLVLRAFVRDGVVPLVGPPASVGAFHHGALYYWALAPAALLSGGNDPLPVQFVFALAGIGAVAVAWWTARAMAGPLAGIVAALLLAVSATSIASSTMLWNPNLVPPAALIAVAAAWRAWSAGRPRWWVVAAAATAIAGQFHVLAWLVAVPVGGLFLLALRQAAPDSIRPGADSIRPGGTDSTRQGGTDSPGSASPDSPGPSTPRRAVAGWGLVGLAVAMLAYVPLVVSELQHGFPDTRGLLAFLAAGGSASPLDPVTRLAVVTIRDLAWPLAGLLTAAPLPAVAAATVVGAGLTWRAAAGRGAEQTAARWLLGSLAAGCAILGLGIGALAQVTPLPVDQYHAALDPLVVLAAALVVSALARRGTAGRVAAGLALSLAVAWNVATWPPPISPDGGWPQAHAAARAVESAVGDTPFALVSLPDFKPPDAYVYPLTADGHAPVAASAARAVVVLCDDLFVANCPGAADAAARSTLAGALPVASFRPAPGRLLAVYRRP